MRSTYAIVYISIGIMLAGCRADMICPAYQSYFLLDEETQKNQFAYFALDSLPRRDIFNTTTNQNGLVAKTSMLAYLDEDLVRNREIRTIYMDVVYPQISDSTLFAGDALMFAETDVVDTVALDSARMAAQTFRYGADQKFYNWYFRGKLKWKDELYKEDDASSDDEEVKEKKGFFGFFKNLFKKKEKEPVENEEVSSDSEATEEDTGSIRKKEKKRKEPKQKKKKSKKERKVVEPVQEEQQKDPPQDEADEDDGEDDF